MDVGVHTPRNNLSIIFVNDAPFPKKINYKIMIHHKNRRVPIQ